jgi:hypothetical protein
MATHAATEAKETEVGVKAVSTRLLDLLAGWSAFVSADEENSIDDASLSAEEIGALCQLAGQASESWDHMSIDDQERAVSTFVEEQILPLLLRRDKSLDSAPAPQSDSDLLPAGSASR